MPEVKLVTDAEVVVPDTELIDVPLNEVELIEVLEDDPDTKLAEVPDDDA